MLLANKHYDRAIKEVGLDRMHTCMEELINACKIWIGTYERKRLLETS